MRIETPKHQTENKTEKPVLDSYLKVQNVRNLTYWCSEGKKRWSLQLLSFGLTPANTVQMGGSFIRAVKRKITKIFLTSTLTWYLLLLGKSGKSKGLIHLESHEPKTN